MPDVVRHFYEYASNGLSVTAWCTCDEWDGIFHDRAEALAAFDEHVDEARAASFAGGPKVCYAPRRSAD